MIKHMYLILGSEATDLGQEDRFDTDMLLFPTLEQAITYLRSIGYIHEDTSPWDVDPPSNLKVSYWVDSSRTARVCEDGLPVLISQDKWKLIGIYKVDCMNTHGSDDGND